MEHTEDGPQVQLATRIPKELHRMPMLHCVSSGILLKDFVTMALREKLAWARAAISAETLQRRS